MMDEENAATMMDTPSDEVDEKEAVKDVMNNIYAQQYFDTTAREFTNEVFNESVQQFLNQMPNLREALLKTATDGKNDEISTVISSEMDSKLAQFAMDFYAHLEKNADALEFYLYEHILTIPSGKVLDQDRVQVHYKELIKKLCSLDDSNDENAESLSSEMLSKKLDSERCELLRKRCEKMRLKFEIELANKTLQRLKSLENSVDSVMSNFEGSLKDFVLKSVAAVKTLPKMDEVLTCSNDK